MGGGGTVPTASPSVFIVLLEGLDFFLENIKEGQIHHPGCLF